MENTRQNLLYILNEYFYTLCICSSLGFSKYNHSPDVRFMMGWYYLGLLGVILCANVTVLIIDIILAIKNHCRLKKQRQKVEEETKRRNLAAGKATLPADVSQNEVGATSKKRSIMANLPVVIEDSNEASDSERSSQKS